MNQYYLPKVTVPVISSGLSAPVHLASALCNRRQSFISSSPLRGHHGNQLPHSSVGKESTCNAGHLGSIPGSGRSPGEENGNPLQYSRLETPMDRGARQATVYGVARDHTTERLKRARETVTFLSRETAGGRPPGEGAVLLLPAAAHRVSTARGAPRDAHLSHTPSTRFRPQPGSPSRACSPRLSWRGRSPGLPSASAPPLLPKASRPAFSCGSSAPQGCFCWLQLCSRRGRKLPRQGREVGWDLEPSPGELAPAHRCRLRQAIRGSK